jgi:hypothetical protein
MAYTLVERLGKDAVSIVDEEAIRVVRRYRFAQLLERPRRRGMCSCIDMQDPVGRVFHDDKHVKQAKGGRDYHTEVTRDDRLSMIADKGAPALSGRAFASTMVHALWHVLAHRAWRYLEAQLQQEFIGNTLLAPCRVLVGHTTDEDSELRREWGASRTRLRQLHKMRE